MIEFKTPENLMFLQNHKNMLLMSVCDNVNCGSTFKETFQLNLFYRFTTFFFTKLLILIAFCFRTGTLIGNHSFILFSCVTSFGNNS